MTITDSGLQYEDLTHGDGDEATVGKMLSVHYTGWFVDGVEFDSSRENNVPLVFPLGRGYVIAGWDEGLVGMRVGGLRRLTVPPQLAYGSAGAGDEIPPDSTLIFEVALLEIL